MRVVDERSGSCLLEQPWQTYDHAHRYDGADENKEGAAHPGQVARMTYASS